MIESINSEVTQRKKLTLKERTFINEKYPQLKTTLEESKNYGVNINFNLNPFIYFTLNSIAENKMWLIALILIVILLLIRVF